MFFFFLSDAQLEIIKHVCYESSMTGAIAASTQVLKSSLFHARFKIEQRMTFSKNETQFLGLEKVMTPAFRS